MMNKPTSIAYIDFLTVIMVFFMVCFVIVFADRKINETEGNFVQKAEFIITLDWNDGSPNDVDLWVQTPSGEVVFFKNKMVGSTFLDVDDVGGGGRDFPSRREIITIRGKEAGTYTVNVVMWQNYLQKPEPIRVVVTKINPYKDIFDKKIVMLDTKSETTIGSFTLDDNNNIVSTDENPVPLLYKVFTEQ